MDHSACTTLFRVLGLRIRRELALVQTSVIFPYRFHVLECNIPQPSVKHAGELPCQLGIRTMYHLEVEIQKPPLHWRKKDDIRGDFGLTILYSSYTQSFLWALVNCFLLAVISISASLIKYVTLNFSAPRSQPKSIYHCLLSISRRNHCLIFPSWGSGFEKSFCTS